MFILLAGQLDAPRLQWRIAKLVSQFLGHARLDRFGAAAGD